MDDFTPTEQLHNNIANYINYVDSGFMKNSNNSKDDYKTILGVYSALFISFTFDQYIKDASNDDIKNKALECGLINKVGDLYYIWPTIPTIEEQASLAPFDSLDKAIEKLRNKLAHGDYIIDNDSFNISETTGISKIGINNLYNYVVDINKYIKESGISNNSMIDGLYLNIDYINHIYNNDETSLLSYICMNSDNHTLYNKHRQDILISNYLAAFYYLYQMPLDTELTNSNGIDADRVMDYKEFYFKELDVAPLYDPNMDIEHQVVCEYKHGETEKIIDSLAKSKQTINRILHGRKESDESLNENSKKGLKYAKEKIKGCYERLAEIMKYNIRKDLLFTLSRTRSFNRNMSIIIHLRNAIAHGTVYIKKYEYDENETILTFIDYYGGKVTYQKDVTLNDFLILFSEDNIKSIIGFLNIKRNTIPKRTLHKQ